MNGYHEKVDSREVAGHERLPKIKCVLLGDGACGKTSLLTVYTEGEFPELYTPTVFENYTTEINLNGSKSIMTLWDTAGQEDYDRLRPMSYDNANVLILCYDVASISSFQNIEVRWDPEVKHFCPGIPKLLVACKTDLRPVEPNLSPGKVCNDADLTVSASGSALSDSQVESHREQEEMHLAAAKRNDIVTTAMGEDLATQIDAADFIECSAKCNINVEKIFATAAQLGMDWSETLQSKETRCCVIS